MEQSGDPFQSPFESGPSGGRDQAQESTSPASLSASAAPLSAAAAAPPQPMVTDAALCRPAADAPVPAAAAGAPPTLGGAPAPYPVLQASLLSNPAKPVPWKSPGGPLAAPAADEEEEIEEEDEQEEREEPGIDQERLKAFNMFVRLFVDENLDRTVPISKQPRERVQAIMDSCARQFPEFGERARKRLRTYLKACRRNKRAREAGGEGGRSLRPAPPHLSSAQAELILATACHNESENARRMMLGLEPVSQPLLLAPAPPSAASLQLAPSAASEVPLRPPVYSQQTSRDNGAGRRQTPTDRPVTTGPEESLTGAGEAVTAAEGAVLPTPIYQANMAHMLQQLTAGAAAPPTLTPGELFFRRAPPPQLSTAEAAAVRQLAAGYREAAAFLRRSADELELLVTQNDC